MATTRKPSQADPTTHPSNVAPVGSVSQRAYAKRLKDPAVRAMIADADSTWRQAHGRSPGEQPRT